MLDSDKYLTCKNFYDTWPIINFISKKSRGNWGILTFRKVSIIIRQLHGTPCLIEQSPNHLHESFFILRLQSKTIFRFPLFEFSKHTVKKRGGRGGGEGKSNRMNQTSLPYVNVWLHKWYAFTPCTNRNNMYPICLQ